MTNDQWFALGVIACGHSYHLERSTRVLQVRRKNGAVLRVCKRAFGGKLYDRWNTTWILRGKALRAFLAVLPENYPVL